MGLFGFLKKTPEVKAKPKTAEELYREADKLDYRKEAEQLALMEQAANLGHLEAQYFCASHYDLARDYAKALYWFEKAAEQGKIFAMKRCADLYKGCKGVEQNPEKILYWQKKWAETGDLEGMSALAYLYRDGGFTIKADVAQSLYWYEKAAEKGHKYSASMLGHMYRSGRWMKTDPAKALYWYEKAVELGDRADGYRCAQMYYEGEGTAVNKEKALAYYETAAKDWHKDAMLCYARMLANGEGAEAADKAEAMFWYWKAAQNSSGWHDKQAQDGIFEAKTALAALRPRTPLELSNLSRGLLRWLYDNDAQLQEFYHNLALKGDLTPQFTAMVLNGEEGSAPLKEAATFRYWSDIINEQGNANTTPGAEDDQAVAGIQQVVSWLEANHPLPLVFYQKLASEGDPTAQFRLASMYLKGTGVEADRTKALYWLAQAGAQGIVAAQIMCGLTYLHDHNGSVYISDAQKERGLFWLEMAAELEHPFAQYMCALMYFEGTGADKSIEKAKMWAQKAAAHGDEKARALLARL